MVHFVGAGSGAADLITVRGAKLLGEADVEDWQLKKLENGFLKEIGEAPSTEEKQERLAQAIRDGKITFFAARRGYRAVGMCSVSRCFPPSPAQMSGYSMIFTLSLCSAKKALPGCWHKRRKNGARKTPLPA